MVSENLSSIKPILERYFSDTLLRSVDEEVENALHGIIFSPLKLFYCTFIAYCFMIDILGGNCSTLIAAMAGVFSVTQIIPPYVLILIPCFQNYFVSESYWLGAMCFLIQFYVDGQLFTNCFCTKLKIHPYLLALLLLLGVTNYGLPGIIYGPALVAFIMIILKVLVSNYVIIEGHAKNLLGNK